MKTVVVEIPDDVLENYNNIDEVKNAIDEDFVADEYKKGNISIRQGAKMLGLTYEQFMVDFLGERKISFINATKGELIENEKFATGFFDRN
jgi:phage antirepressor YoqD-like protein